ncbi:MAG: radical SAM protein [Candidatus Omnitrophica bacterium]|nr:radical SAM protein [Candidatus Omnitrophota bacterium]
MKFLMIYANDTANTKVPIGILYILTRLKKEGHEVSMFDSSKYAIDIDKNDYAIRGRFLNFQAVDLRPYGVTFESVTMEQLDQKLKEHILNFCPDLIGISILEDTSKTGLHFAEICKKVAPKVPLIVGGVYCLTRPEYVIENKFVDIVCVGEGEESISELMFNLSKGKSFEAISNLWIKLPDGDIKKNAIGYPTELDSLPYIDLSIIEDRHLFAPFAGHAYKTSFVEGQRGCPRRCTYCCNQIFLDAYSKFGAKYLRRKTVNRLIQEIVYLKDNFGLNFIQFIDDDFLFSPLDRIKEFSESYKKHVNLPFWIQAEACNVTEEKIKLIRKAGCISISIGIETGSKYILEKIMKRKTSQEITLKAFKIMHRHGIRTSANVILGMPEETRENIFETIEFVRKCKPVSINSNIFVPYYGTALREYCVEKGYLDKDYHRGSRNSWKAVLNMPQISQDEVENLSRVFVLYATLSKKYWAQIGMVEKFPEKSLELQRKLENIFWKIVCKRGINIDVRGYDYSLFFKNRQLELQSQGKNKV